MLGFLVSLCMNVQQSNVVTMRQITVNNNAWLFILVMYECTAMECCYHETNNRKQQCLAFQSRYV